MYGNAIANIYPKPVQHAIPGVLVAGVLTVEILGEEGGMEMETITKELLISSAGKELASPWWDLARAKGAIE